MRILHLAHLSKAECNGGVQEYVHGVAKRAQRLGHEVAIFAGSLATDSSGGVESASFEGIPFTTVHRTPHENFSGDFGSDRIGQILDQTLTAFQPDLCHIHHWQGLTNDIVRRCAAFGARTVVTLHDLYTTCALFFRMRVDTESCRSDLPLSDCAMCLLGGFPDTGPVAMEAMLASRHRQLQHELLSADAVCTMSAYMRERLQTVPYFRRHDLEVLPIGVMREHLDVVPAPTPIPGRLRLANWAGIAPRKGLHLLVSALADSVHVDAFELSIYGGESNAAYVEDLKARAGRLRVHWHGAFSDSAALSAIAASHDLAVFPSLEEPYGIAQDEAMLLGMPILVSDQGAPKERILGRGATFTNGSVSDLRAQLESLLERPQRVAAMRASESGAWHVERHLPELFALYDRVVATPRHLRLGEPAEDTAEALLARARSLRAQGDLRRTILNLNLLLDRSPHHQGGRLERGSAWLHLREPVRATHDFDAAIELDPNSASLFQLRGRAWIARGDATIAIGNLDRALELDPSLAAAYADRGLAWLMLGQLETAIANLDRALVLDPDYAPAYLHRGRAWLAKGDPQTALGNLDRAVELAPTSTEAFEVRGQTWQALGATQIAIESYSMAIAIDPRRASTYHLRCLALEALGDHPRAARDLRQFHLLSSVPRSPFVTPT